jgi:hypothetical protein
MSCGEKGAMIVLELKESVLLVKKVKMVSLSSFESI